MTEDDKIILQIIEESREKQLIQNDFTQRLYYQKLDHVIGNLNMRLFLLQYKLDARCRKLVEDKHVIPPERLITRASNQLKKLKEKDPYPFCYPSVIRTSPNIYFSNNFAYEYFSYLLINGGIEHCLSLWKELNIQNIEAVRMTILSIKSLCDTVSKTKDISSILCEVDRYRINNFLQQVCCLCERSEVNFEEKELNRERGRRNASSVTRTNMNKIKNHQNYLKVKDMLQVCKGKPDRSEVGSLNRLLGEILGTRNRGTLRSYRRKLWKNIEKEPNQEK